MNIELLLVAILFVESGGDPSAVGDAGRARGIYQIQSSYWDDGCRILGVEPKGEWAYRRGSHSPAKSGRVVLAYLSYYGQRYARLTGERPTLEVLARIHNGGPDGWRKHATLPYWTRVEHALDRFERKRAPEES